MSRRESDLSNQGYYLLAQELVYQWLGSWVSPQWWTDAHVNKAVAGFLAASTANEVNYIVLGEKLLYYDQYNCNFSYFRSTMAENLTGSGQ